MVFRLRSDNKSVVSKIEADKQVGSIPTLDTTDF